MNSKSNQTATKVVISGQSDVLDLNTNFKINTEVKRMHPGECVGDGALNKDSQAQRAASV